MDFPYSPLELWQKSVKTALLGTSRSKIPEDVLSLAKRDDLDSNRQFLYSIGVLAQMRKVNPTLQNWNGPLPTQAISEVKKTATAEQGLILQEILSSNYPLALKEYLELCQKTQTILPPEALPALFDRHWNRDVEADDLWGLIGHRGEWLMQQHPKWSTFLPLKDPAIWETGSDEERLRLFAFLRVHDPSLSIQLLEGSWDSETPNFKRKAILGMASNPQATEEPLLEAWLDHSRKEVRKAAASVLALRPLAQRGERFWHYLLPYLKVKSNSKKLKVNRQINLLPEMVKDGVDLRPQLDLRTDNAGKTLVQLVKGIPPRYWRDYFEGAADEEIVQKLYHGVEGQEMILGLQLAAQQFRDQEMIGAILKFWIQKESPSAPTPIFAFELIKYVHQKQIDQLLHQGIYGEQSHLFEQSIFVGLLKSARLTWSGKNTANLIVFLDRWVRNDPASYWGGSYYRAIVNNLAYRAELSPVKTYIHSLRLAETLNRSIGQQVDQAIDIFKFRVRMWNTFAEDQANQPAS